MDLFRVWVYWRIATLQAMFKCPRAADIWQCLKLDGFVEEAFAVDRAGPAALDYILCESA